MNDIRTDENNRLRMMLNDAGEHPPQIRDERAWNEQEWKIRWCIERMEELEGKVEGLERKLNDAEEALQAKDLENATQHEEILALKVNELEAELHKNKEVDEDSHHANNRKILLRQARKENKILKTQHADQLTTLKDGIEKKEEVFQDKLNAKDHEIKEISTNVSVACEINSELRRALNTAEANAKETAKRAGKAAGRIDREKARRRQAEKALANEQRASQDKGETCGAVGFSLFRRN